MFKVQSSREETVEVCKYHARCHLKPSRTLGLQLCSVESHTRTTCTRALWTWLEMRVCSPASRHLEELTVDFRHASQGVVEGVRQIHTPPAETAQYETHLGTWCFKHLSSSLHQVTHDHFCGAQLLADGPYDQRESSRWRHVEQSEIPPNHGSSHPRSPRSCGRSQLCDHFAAAVEA